MKRESMIIYRSFFEAIKDLPKENQAEVWNAIFEYGLDFKEPKLKGLSNTIFTLIKPQLDANINRYNNGTKPKQKISKQEAKDKQKISKVEANVNDNVNVNENIIPSVDEFLAYALNKEPNINTNEVRLKYESWLVNDWSVIRNNKTIKIKNWKSTLLNTIPYISKIQPQVKSLDEQLYENVMKQMKAKK